MHWQGGAFNCSVGKGTECENGVREYLDGAPGLHVVTLADHLEVRMSEQQAYRSALDNSVKFKQGVATPAELADIEKPEVNEARYVGSEDEVFVFSGTEWKSASSLFMLAPSTAVRPALVCHIEELCEEVSFNLGAAIMHVWEAFYDSELDDDDRKEALDAAEVCLDRERARLVREKQSTREGEDTQEEVAFGVPYAAKKFFLFVANHRTTTELFGEFLRNLCDDNKSFTDAIQIVHSANAQGPVL